MLVLEPRQACSVLTNKLHPAKDLRDRHPNAELRQRQKALLLLKEEVKKFNGPANRNV